MWIIRHFILQTFLLSLLESDIEGKVWLLLSNAGCLELLITGNDFVRYFSNVKDDKHTMETCFYNGNVRFFIFICETGVSRYYPTFKF